MKLDINSDMGEGFGRWTVADDAEMLKIVSSANIACGYHAGDHDIMAKCVSGAKAAGVAIGAHPGFRDLIGFGRRAMPVDQSEMCNMLAYQIGSLQAIGAVVGLPVTHVSYHAAFGNAAAADADLALAMAKVIAAIDRELIVYAQQDTEVENAARKVGLRVMNLFLADRAYQPDGALVSRGKPGAVVTDHGEIAQRVARFIEDGTVVTSDGSAFPIRAKGVLVHSDTPGSIELAQTVRSTFDKMGVEVAPSAELAT